MSFEKFYQRLESAFGTYVSTRGGTMSSLAREVGVTPTTIKRYLSGQVQPSVEKATKLASALNVDLLWLVLGESVPPNGIVQIPIESTQFSAGGGAFESSGEPPIHETTYWPLSRDYLVHHLGRENTKDLLALIVYGDSMIPTLFDGDIVVVEKQERNLKRDGIYAIRSENMLMIKRLQRVTDGIKVVSDNKNFYSSDFLTHLQLQETNFFIIGRVVALISSARF